jgi:tetratricopeptide (TPR) repeat protein
MKNFNVSNRKMETRNHLKNRYNLKKLMIFFIVLSFSAALQAQTDNPTTPVAQNHLGNKYYDSKDYSEALKWYRKSAEQGDEDAQNNLGYMYKEGLGVAKDYSEALKWYRKSAEQGNEDAIAAVKELTTTTTTTTPTYQTVSTSPSAEIDKIWLEHSAVIGQTTNRTYNYYLGWQTNYVNVYGMKIHIKFSVENMLYHL